MKPHILGEEEEVRGEDYHPQSGLRRPRLMAEAESIFHFEGQGRRGEARRGEGPTFFGPRWPGSQQGLMNS